MELRHLRYFVAVAEELHFGRAARRLGIAQPPLSQQILRLEEELKVKLLMRSKHRVELTSAGSIFLHHAQHLLADADKAVQLARQADRGEIGQLRIGHTHAADLKALPEVLSIFGKRYPRVGITLKRSSAPELIAAVRSQQLDVGVLRLPAVCDDLTTTVISQEPLIVAVPENHPLADYPRVPLRSIAAVPHVLFPRHRAPGYFDFLANICKQAGFTLTIAQESDSLQTTLSLVSMGLGVSLQPECVQQLARSGVAFRYIEGETPILKMAAIHRPGNMSENLKRFLAVAEDNFRHSLTATNT